MEAVDKLQSDLNRQMQELNQMLDDAMAGNGVTGEWIADREQTGSILVLLDKMRVARDQLEKIVESYAFNQETEQARMYAQHQAAHDMPYVEVMGARLYQYHETSGRWYVEVDLQHSNPDEGTAIALYRVWRSTDGSLSAIKVDIAAGSQEAKQE